MSGATTAAAIVGAGALGAVGSTIAGNKAASAQKQSAQNATNVQQQMFNTTQQNLEPYNTTGQDALTRANSLAGNFNFNPTMAQISQTPGFQFENYFGQKAVNNAASARGLGNSGAALKGATNYAQGLASTDWQNYFNTALQGYQANLGGLQNVANLGESAAAGVGNAATNTGALIGSNVIGSGNAQAGSYMNAANAFGNAIQGVPNAILTQNLINRLPNNGIYGATSGGVGTGNYLDDSSENPLPLG